jgi:hypothetical protein
LMISFENLILIFDIRVSNTTTEVNMKRKPNQTTLWYYF